jgi:hypothetical protein
LFEDAEESRKLVPIWLVAVPSGLFILLASSAAKKGIEKSPKFSLTYVLFSDCERNSHLENKMH